MERGVVECVPNFSEGRDERTVAAIVNAIAATPGVTVLGSERDRDHNRSVVTFSGAPQAVVAGAFRGIQEAVQRIDIATHSGVHPRMGAADVIPLVPVQNISLQDCVRLAHELGAEVWRLLRVPVYFYEAAARSEERRRLEDVRRGGVEWLRDHIAERPPDIGDCVLHPAAGAVAIGARTFLIAFNVNLATSDLAVARSIARAIRESSGGLPSLKAIGVALESLGIVQVSMNLTDFERTGMGAAFEAVRSEAARHGVEIAGSELIGFVPRRAVQEATAALLHCTNFSADRVLEDRMEALAPRLSLDEILDRIASPNHPMGGGSAAALGGALSAALGHLVASICGLDPSCFDEHREFFTRAAQGDAEAFGQVQSSGRSPEALRIAAEVPTAISERARLLDRDLIQLKDQAPSKLQSDITTALGLARASRAGGIATAQANLESIDNADFRTAILERLNRKLAH